MPDFINMAPPPFDHLLSGPDPSAFDDGLAMFTHAEYFDFDTGETANLQVPNFERSAENDLKPYDLSGDFAYPEYNPYPPQPNGFGEGPLPIQTNLANNYASSPTATASPGIHSPSTGEKRKADSSTFEEASRLAAEEDKRRRNTAASARFRIKKKQREQALEQSAKQMSDKMAALESRINQLETENKWLKNLITEKNDKRADVESMFKKFQQDRKTEEGKDGVGTEGKEKA